MSTSELKPVRVCGFEARVVLNEPICREHVRIELAAAGFPESEPGQFLQLRCRDADEVPPRAVDWSNGTYPSLFGENSWLVRKPFLRRPLSIADQWRGDHGSQRLCLILRAIGPGTGWLSELRAGDSLNATGPLGRGFQLPATDIPAILIGGGVGIPPLLYLARRLHERGHHDVVLILGSGTRDLLPVRLIGDPSVQGLPRACVELPGRTPFQAIVTTDDGSCGLHGLVTDALDAWCLQRGGGGRQRGAVFACGPEPMLRAVARQACRAGLNCQVCIERNMGCGLGTCLSCVVRVRDESRSEGWRWALTCKDGPVFDPDDLLDW